MATLIAVMILITNNSYYLPIDVGAKCCGNAREGVIDFGRGNLETFQEKGQLLRHMTRRGWVENAFFVLGIQRLKGREVWKLLVRCGAAAVCPGKDGM